MALAISDKVQSPEIFNQGLQTVTDGVLQSDPTTVGDSLEKFQGTDFPGGDIANPASFPDPQTGVTALALADKQFQPLQAELSNPELNVNAELTSLSPFLRTPISQFLSPNVEGVAANAGKSGEEILGDTILDTQSSLDDLMQEASTLDPSTKEGQQRLAQIQLEFQQKSRTLQILSQMLNDFQTLMKQIIQNL
jgi:hypothetical protein